MAQDPLDADPGSLVKQFSWEIEGRPTLPNHDENDEELRLVLIEETRRKQLEAEAEIRKIDEYYTSARPSDEQAFREMRSKLLQAMKNFRSLSQKHTEQALLPTSWEDVNLVISEIQAKWDTKNQESRMTRIKSGFRKLCDGIRNHSAALEMLPSESEYVSVISGCISMILKASANYDKIIASFTEGIIEINEAVGATQRETFMRPTPALQQLAMRLYTHVFSYLTRFMTWFTDRSRKRFLHSFNENLRDIFEQDLANIRKICSLISRHIQIQIAVDANASRFYSEAAYDNTRFILDLQEAETKNTRIRDAANAELFQHVLRQGLTKSNSEMAECMRNIMGEYMENVRRQVTGEALVKLLEQQASDGVAAIRRQLSSSDVPRSRLLRLSSYASTASGQETPLSRSQASLLEQLTDNEDEPACLRGDDVKLWSRHLEDYFDREHCFPLVDPQRPLLVDANFVASLKRFTLTMESQILYAHGEYQEEDDDMLRHSAAQYVVLCRSSKVPVVAHFCSLSHDEPPPNRTRETMELAALLYSMIRQVIDILPVELPAGAPFGKTRFQEVDGTLRTWDQALKLFADVVRHVQLPVLVFVIDRVNVLEVGSSGANVSRKLGALVDCLRALRETVAERGQIIKVLFTTAGLSPSLVERIDIRDTVNCETSSASRGRRPRKSFEPLAW
ncbi:hypothetical protein GQ53DRAFT_839826 [Thozetella sp. PMI_491]|nr:hypothetical protein GQ53DRAFT_839826 [Thozetella sp. PMI_491]